jgi:hypothetical protein
MRLGVLLRSGAGQISPVMVIFTGVVRGALVRPYVKSLLL